MAELNTALLRYFGIRHLSFMTPAVRDRFDDMQANGELNRTMTWWENHDMGRPIPDFTVTPAPGNNNYGLTNDQWRQLFKSVQKTLESMFGEIHGAYKEGAVYNFLQNWFDGDYTQFGATQPRNVTGRIFSAFHATNTADTILSTQLADFLQNNKNSGLAALLSSQSRAFSDGTSYDTFVTKLRAHDYNSDPVFREKVKQLVTDLKWFCERADYWPHGLSLPNDIRNMDIDAAFDVDYTNLPLFQQHYTELLDRLVNNATVRNAFIKHNSDRLIAGPLEQAMKDTNYDNPDDSKSYQNLEPLFRDERNLGQSWKRFKNNTYENYLRKFTNPSRGTRLFFSAQAQNIVTAFDKAGIKPTDELEGILAKDKDGSLAKEIGNSASVTKDHYDWFIKKLKELQTEIPNAFKGALHNGAQLKAIASAIIVKAVQEGKATQAKTALEVLSVAKYGMLCSNTMDKINEGLKDAKLFSDDKLSWNKNEGIKTVTKAIDATAKLSVRAIGAAGTGIYNFIQHRRTKIGNDIRNNRNLRNAYAMGANTHLQQTATTDRTNADNALNNFVNQHPGLMYNGQPVTRANVEQYLQDAQTTAQNDFNNAQMNLNNAQMLENDYNNFRQNTADMQPYQQTIQQHNPILQNLEAQIQQLQQSGQQIDANLMLAYNQERQLVDEARQHIDELQQQNNNINSRHNGDINRECQQLFPNLPQNANYSTQLRANTTSANTLLQQTQNGLNTANTNYGLAANFQSADTKLQQIQHDITNARNSYDELIAYWDMLESTMISHDFSLGALTISNMGNRRRQFRQNEAQTVVNDFRTAFGGITY